MENQHRFSLAHSIPLFLFVFSLIFNLSPRDVCAYSVQYELISPSYLESPFYSLDEVHSAPGLTSGLIITQNPDLSYNIQYDANGNIVSFNTTSTEHSKIESYFKFRVLSDYGSFQQNSVLIDFFTQGSDIDSFRLGNGSSYMGGWATITSSIYDSDGFLFSETAGAMGAYPTISIFSNRDYTLKLVSELTTYGPVFAPSSSPVAYEENTTFTQLFGVNTKLYVGIYPFEQEPVLTAIPEPSTMLLMGIGAAGVAFVRRKKKIELRQVIAEL